MHSEARPRATGAGRSGMSHFAVAAVLFLAPFHAAAQRQQVLHIVFDAKGNSIETQTDGQSVTGTQTATEEWHASWDVTIPNMRAGFPNSQNFGPALPGAWVTGTTTVNIPSANLNCSGQPVVNTLHAGVSTPSPQSPYIGFRDLT